MFLRYPLPLYAIYAVVANTLLQPEYVYFNGYDNVYYSMKISINANESLCGEAFITALLISTRDALFFIYFN